MTRPEWITGPRGAVDVADVGDRWKPTREAHIVTPDGVTVERWRTRRNRLEYHDGTGWRDGVRHWSALPQWARHGVIDALNLLKGD